MKIIPDLFYQLSYTYFTFFENPLMSESSLTNVREEAIDLLRILNIKVNRVNPLDKYTSFENLKFKDPFKLKNNPIFNNKIIPAALDRQDIERMEIILNSMENMFSSIYMAPLFDCIGWILSQKSGKWKIYFIGGSIYDPWNTIEFEKNNWLLDFDESIFKDDKKWYEGNNWPDGITEKGLKNFNWKEK